MPLTNSKPLEDSQEPIAPHDFNQTRTIWPVEYPDLCTMIEEQAALHPWHLAVQCENRALTYLDLNTRSDRLACQLQALGAGPNICVGALLPRSEDMVVALLAIQKTGATCVPLQPSYPPEHTAVMMQDTRMEIIVTTVHLLSNLAIRPPRSVCLDVESPLEIGTRLKPWRAAPDDVAFVMFTSGSTGRPKAVTLTHQAVVNLMLALQHTPGITSDDSVLSLANATFDPWFCEVYLPLAFGARTTIVPREVATSGFRLKRFIETWKPTIISATPATYHMLVEARWTGHHP